MKNPSKRLTSSWFLERYRRFLTDRGIIHLKTDSNFLFTYTSYLVEKNHLPVITSTTNLYADSTVVDGFPIDSTAVGGFPADNIAASIQTYYESMWLARGISIKYIQFLLPHDGLLEEPDVEIELDDYRSYHRTKRSPLKVKK